MTIHENIQNENTINLNTLELPVIVKF